MHMCAACYLLVLRSRSPYHLCHIRIVYSQLVPYFGENAFFTLKICDRMFKAVNSVFVIQIGKRAKTHKEKQYMYKMWFLIKKFDALIKTTTKAQQLWRCKTL